MIDFSGQVAIVTGAGRGLGRLFALDLAKRGASVVVNDLGGTMAGHGSDSSVADAVVAEIKTAGGIAVASHDSVATPEGGAAIVQTAIERFGRLDAVVSNAGIFNSSAFDELPIAEWRRMLEVHLDGGFYLSQPAYRVMKAQGHGRFVFMASSAGLFGQPLEAHYAAAKCGLVGLTNVIAIEGAEHGIVANCVLPFASTRMLSETVAAHAPGMADNPFLRALEAELIVPMAVYLASRDCEITHQNFSVGAGRFSRVFIGLAEGWLAVPGTRPTAEDVAENLDKISATQSFTVPESIFDEVMEICERRGISLVP